MLDALPEQPDAEAQPLFLIDLDYLKPAHQADWSKVIHGRFGKASTVLLNVPVSTDLDGPTAADSSSGRTAWSDW